MDSAKVSEPGYVLSAPHADVSPLLSGRRWEFAGDRGGGVTRGICWDRVLSHARVVVWADGGREGGLATCFLGASSSGSETPAREAQRRSAVRIILSFAPNRSARRRIRSHRSAAALRFESFRSPGLLRWWLADMPSCRPRCDGVVDLWGAGAGQRYALKVPADVSTHPEVI